ncbi:hypothetical protein P7C70_g2556, partial [Phenoliferia sp. Uapishka_3]
MSNRPCAVFQLSDFLPSTTTTREESTSTWTAPEAVWSNEAWTAWSGGDEIRGTSNGSNGSATNRLLEKDDEKELLGQVKEWLRRPGRAVDGIGSEAELEVMLRMGQNAKALLMEAEGIIILSILPPTPAKDQPSPPPPPTPRDLGASSPSPRPSLKRNKTIVPPPTPPTTTHNSSENVGKEVGKGYADIEWIRKEFAGTIMGPLIVDYPWENTSLGPMTAWPKTLLVCLATMLSSPFREYLAWGPDFLFIYNDAYLGAAGSKHPAILGLRTADAFPEVWPAIDKLMKEALEEGKTHLIPNAHVPLRRNKDLSELEESYHTYSYTPVRDETGKILGLLNRSFETTLQVVAERRLSTVRDLVQKTSLCRTVPSAKLFLHDVRVPKLTLAFLGSDFCDMALECLSLNPYDLPFAMIWTGERTESKLKPKGREPDPLLLDTPGGTCRPVTKLTCRGAVGLPPDHPLFVKEAFLDNHHTSLSAAASSDSTGRTSITPAFNWPFDEASETRQPVYVQGPTFEAFAATLPGRAWGENPRAAVVVPILTEAGNAAPLSFLVAGLNPRSTFGELYLSFTHIVARHVGIGLLAVTNAEADRRRSDELLALDRAKTSFFSNTSHELRTPLTLVLGPLDDILNGHAKLDEGVHASLMIIQRNANRLLNLINKLLDFSALEAGKKNTVFQPVNLGSFTADLAQLFKEAIEREGLQFVVEVDPDPDFALPVYISRDLYTHVIFNLLSNSLKYSTHGTITVRIKPSLTEVVLEVEDEGVGIPTAELDNIFERFHRIERTRDVASGTGIGLALTLEMCKSLHATIDVKSEVNKGSIFSVRFRRGFVHLPAESVSHDEREEVTSTAKTTRVAEAQIKDATYHRDASSPVLRRKSLASIASGPSTGDPSVVSPGSGSGEYFEQHELWNVNGATIVLVDDNPDLLSYIGAFPFSYEKDSTVLITLNAFPYNRSRSVLRKHFNVVEFTNGRSALEYALQQPPELILTDVMMPLLNGRELLKELRSNPSTAQVPVIFLSAQAGLEARSLALEQGADDYLVKPFQSRELLARVRGLLMASKLRTQLETKVQERTAELNDSKARLRDLARRYATLSDVSPVGLFTLDSTPSVVYTNPRWYEITGHLPSRPLSLWTEAVLPEDLPRLLHEFKEALEDRPTGTLQFRLQNKRWVQLGTCILNFQDLLSIDLMNCIYLLETRQTKEPGMEVRLVCAITDISAQKKLELLHIETVEQRALDAEKHRKHIEQFIDIASHEVLFAPRPTSQATKADSSYLQIRNPLSSVLQNAECLGKSLKVVTSAINRLQAGGVLDDATLNHIASEMRENDEAVEAILICAAHQGRIADDILDISKLNMGLLNITVVTFNILDKLRDVARMFEASCSRKNISLSVDHDASILELDAKWVKADPSRLAQALQNFVLNSIKFTSEGGNIQIKLSASSTPPPARPGVMRVGKPRIEEKPTDSSLVWISCSVVDNGRGLTVVEREALFERFAQARPKTDQYGGSGLGLYVTLRLIELHDGFIEVDSEPGHGSTFAFHIPVERVERASPSTATPSFISPKLHEAQPPVFSSVVNVPKSPHVLVVEDNTINQRVLKRQLTSNHWDVSIANNGAEALEALKAADEGEEGAKKIDVVLMDIEMPVMNGLDAIRELRARELAGQMSTHYVSDHAPRLRLGLTVSLHVCQNVICLTGNARKEQVEEYLQAGFEDVSHYPLCEPGIELTHHHSAGGLETLQLRSSLAASRAASWEGDARG